MSAESSFYQMLNELLKKFEINFKPDSLFFYYSFKKNKSVSSIDKFIIYEDWWINKPEIVKSKVKSILGISEKIQGRKCRILKITKPVADTFLNENHIYGTTNSKIKYGLFFGNELFAVATFAGQRQFKDERSVELLRFCTKNGFSVAGGLDKLLKQYIKDHKPDSLMTYIDIDWGKGNSFAKLGFETIKIMPPVYFLIDKIHHIRISHRNFDDFKNIENYYNIENRGSIKMIKNINYE
jgi:hypothetical protein